MYTVTPMPPKAQTSIHKDPPHPQEGVFAALLQVARDLAPTPKQGAGTPHLNHAPEKKPSTAAVSIPLEHPIMASSATLLSAALVAVASMKPVAAQQVTPSLHVISETRVRPSGGWGRTPVKAARSGPRPLVVARHAADQAMAPQPGLRHVQATTVQQPSVAAAGQRLWKMPDAHRATRPAGGAATVKPAAGSGKDAQPVLGPPVMFGSLAPPGAARPTPVATPTQAIAVHVSARIRSWIRAAPGSVQRGLRIVLNPPSMGTVHLRLVQSAQGLVARIVVQNHAVQQSLRLASPSLADELAGMGIAVERLTIGLMPREPGRPKGRAAPINISTEAAPGPVRATASDTASQVDVTV